MIEIIIKQFLDGHLSAPSFLKSPEIKPDRYVLIEKTGSSKSNHLPSATFAFQSYDETMYKAAELNEELKEVVENLIILNEIRGVKINSDYYYPDTTAKKERYQAVFDINHY